MRIYISADMEGITGLVDADDVQPSGRDYEHGRMMMTEDVNAAVRGALTAGATTVTVNDAHGPMRNLLPELLHPAARLVRGKPKNMIMLEGLDATYDAVLCVGFHSRAGTLGVMSHSFMGHEIEDMWLEDRPVGEIGLAHATAAALGVPVVMLSGDDTACAEMTDWDSTVTCVAVKHAGGRFAAELPPLAEARQAIETAVASSLTTRQAAALTAHCGTSTLTVRWQSASVASTLLGIPGVTSADSRTVQASGPLPDLYRLFGVWTRVATALTNQAPYC
ncbi:M55 family metallopeptidase [Streptomyces sp. NBC_00257]|uniref:M55 family metallopeptidase n=1 Tax=unclassified Streptomyces TaxID=2593676 RepID=UPI00224D6D01|nr:MULTISPECIES: M55 family metallopeptidase [unclassified Streptomyces]MCX4398782.1 M55 family metallopeptidase [Streptomyces sp. NBC_01767]MCX4870908.1 M55 family metallopeptidase [Streptomyces sp. NBC_00906]MCX4901648.1 M55 family metallopeptidase [Streptomyces sp. NBC_00892]MCX5426891.1 M55 family metallopeptidase [Streptomyces sp. NBC_00062]WSP52225.1 M55 family metallopeptidase [Streptomyces sp. NBC_01243]